MTKVTAFDVLALARMVEYTAKRYGADSQLARDYAAEYERKSADIRAQAARVAFPSEVSIGGDVNDAVHDTTDVVNV